MTMEKISPAKAIKRKPVVSGVALPRESIT
jgi:hypothetical protein